MTAFPYIIRNDSITLFPPGEAPRLIDRGHVNFTAVRDALYDGDFDDAYDMSTVATYVNTISKGNVTVSDDGVFYKGNRLTGYLASQLSKMHAEGIPMEHYILFLDNLMNNPSMRAREELYLFLEAADLPITEDGCFLAYKAVGPNFFDKHSGKFDNSPGKTHEMPRADVDDDRNRTCSYGFHAAAYEYARNFMGYGGGDKLVAVKINPADVVAVPADYNNQKLRTAKYTVLFEILGAMDVFKDRSYVDLTANYDAGTDTYFWGVIFDENDDNDSWND